MNGRKIVLILLIIGLTIGVSAALHYRYSLVSGTVKVEEPVITTSPINSYTANHERIFHQDEEHNDW